jgi:hypothetical protein
MKRYYLLSLLLMVCTGAFAVPTVNSLEQTQYRWRNNNGSETAATWKAAANTPVTQTNFNESLRLRTEYYTFGLSGSLPLGQSLAYSKDGGITWTPITEATTNDFVLVPSAAAPPGTNTTNQLGTGTGGTYVAGKIVSQNTPAMGLNLNVDERTEMEWILQPTIFCENAKTYLFESQSVTAASARGQLTTNFGCVTPVVTVAPSISRCGTGSLQLVASIDGTGGSLVWWSAPTGGTIIGVGNNVTSPVYTANTTVYVEGRRNGCATTRIPVQIIVDNVSLSIDVADGTYCVDDVLPLTTSPSYPATYIYQWSDNSTAAALDVAPTNGVQNQFWVKVTSPNGCVKRDTVHVTVNPKLQVNIGNDTIVCSNTPLTLDAGNPGATYLWSTGAQTQSITTLTGGTYTVAVTNDYDCTTTDEIVIGARLEASTDGFNFIPKFEIQQGRVDFAPINAQAVDSFYWDFGDGNTSQLQEPSHVFAAEGDYIVSLKVKNDCGFMDTALMITVDMALGVHESKIGKNDLKVFPVPAANKLTVLSETGDIKIMNITICNALGQVQKDLQYTGGSRQEIDVTNQPAGNYFMRIETNKGTAYRRFSITK